MPKLTVVIASTRPGRVGLPVGQWFTARAEAHGGFEVEVADLAELALPLLDEPNHPRLWRYTKPHTRAWSQLVEGSDAFVFVTPEYNHGYPAALNMMPLFEAVAIPFVAQFIDDEGAFRATEVIEQAADGMLDELLRVQAAPPVLREDAVAT